MKKFQLLKWTAEVREKELQFLFFNGHSVDLKESELLCIHIFNHCGLKFANVDCLMLQEVEVDEDGDVVECEYLDIRYPEGE